MIRLLAIALIALTASGVARSRAQDLAALDHGMASNESLGGRGAVDFSSGPSKR